MELSLSANGLKLAKTIASSQFMIHLEMNFRGKDVSITKIQMGNKVEDGYTGVFVMEVFLGPMTKM